MKRMFVLLGLAWFAFTLPAGAGPLEDQFFQMDTSRDGIISRTEFVAFRTNEGATERQANFAFDNTAGDDGRISLNEFRAGPVGRTQRRITQRRATPRPDRSSRPQRPRRTQRPIGGGSLRGGGS